MAFTQAQLDALESAIAEGVTKVKYEDKEVTYRSLEEMQRIRNLMRDSLGASDNSGAMRYPTYSKGLW